MRNIAELTMLFRGCVDLSNHFKIESEDFREGWKVVQSGDSFWLDKAVRSRGWHFIWIAEGVQKSGVGATPEEAVASALTLALRTVSERYNAAGVDRVELKKYPWFCLAKVRISPYQIQPGAEISIVNGPGVLTLAPAKMPVAMGTKAVPAAL
jgi:hypothetical protein